MVLRHKSTKQGARFIFGIGIIAVSIYLFYIALAKNNSPELFIIPETEVPGEYLCRTQTMADYCVCIPEDLTVNKGPEGIQISSKEKRILGSIEIMNTLAKEKQWRESLQSPLIKLFINDMDDMDTFTLMLRILEFRYNPSLMGVKAKLMPPWMRTNPDAAIIIPAGTDAIIFYTPSQVLGLAFHGKEIVTLSLTGHIDQAIATGIMNSIRPI